MTMGVKIKVASDKEFDLDYLYAEAGVNFVTSCMQV